jgi:hypothetical protein
MCDALIDPSIEREWEDYVAIKGGALILCESCVQTICSAARTEGMLGSRKNPDAEKLRFRRVGRIYKTEALGHTWEVGKMWDHAPPNWYWEREDYVETGDESQRIGFWQWTKREAVADLKRHLEHEDKKRRNPRKAPPPLYKPHIDDDREVVAHIQLKDSGDEFEAVFDCYYDEGYLPVIEHIRRKDDEDGEEDEIDPDDIVNWNERTAKWQIKDAWEEYAADYVPDWADSDWRRNPENDWCRVCGQTLTDDGLCYCSEQ